MDSLRIARENKGMTQKELAASVGLAASTIANYETGKREPDLSTLCQIADVLDCSLDMLIRGKEKDRPEERSKEGLMKLFDSMSLPELRLAQALVSMTIAYKELQLAPGSDGQ